MKLKSRQATDIPFYMKDIDLTTELLKYQQADNYTTTHFLPLLSERQRKSDRLFRYFINFLLKIN